MLTDGQQIGSYRITGLLGRGGFAEVYRASHVELRMDAAIKVSRTRLDAQQIRRFKQEARLIARLEHPHIIRILDYATLDDTPYIIMAFAPGGTLRQRHGRGEVVSPGMVRDYLQQVAPALTFAHGRKVIHRDIKPENLLLDQHGNVLLSDFGIALAPRSQVETLDGSHRNPASDPEHPHLSWSGEHSIDQDPAGTPPYMAPEQSRGLAVAASDQYALAIVAYEWLTGTRPFSGSALQLAYDHLQTSPPSPLERNPNLPRAVEDVLLTALEKDPAHRFPSIADFVEAFARSIPTRPRTTARPPISNPPERTSHQPIQPVPLNDPYHISPIELPVQQPIVRSIQPAVDPNAARTFYGPGTSYPASPPPYLPPTQPGRLVHLPAPHSINSKRRNLIIAGCAAAGLVAVGGITIAIQNRDQIVRAIPLPGVLPAAMTTLFIYSKHSNIVESVAWSPDGSTIVSAGQDKTAQVFDANTGNRIYVFKKHFDIVRSVGWSPDSKYVVSGGFDQAVRVWLARTGSDVSTYKGLHRLVGTVAWPSTTLAGQKIAAAGLNSDEVDIIDPQKGQKIIDYHNQGNSTNTIAWSSDGLQIAIGSGGSTVGDVQVWDVVKNSRAAAYTGHAGGVLSVCWSPDRQYIASGGGDKTVHVWRIASNKRVAIYEGQKDVINAVAWSPNGKYIASGSNDGSVHVWNALTGIIRNKYTAHLDAVKGLAWSPDGSRVASASADNTVRVWQAV